MGKFREKWKKIFHTEKKHDWLNFIDISLSILSLAFLILADVMHWDDFLYSNMSTFVAAICLFLIYMFVVSAIFFCTYCIDQHLIKKENKQSKK